MSFGNESRSPTIGQNVPVFVRRLIVWIKGFRKLLDVLANVASMLWISHEGR